MNTLSTIDGQVVDDDSPTKPPKPAIKSRMLSRALSAGRSRVPPSYKDAERSLSPPPRKLKNNRDDARKDPDTWDAREEMEPSTKPVLNRSESHPDDASRDEASVNSGEAKPVVKERTNRRYIERAASTGRARSTGRFRFESRPRYRDQPKRPNRETRDDTFERQTTIDNSEFEPKVSFSIQTGIQPNVSGLTATSPRALQGGMNYQAMREVPPPPPPQVHSVPVTPEHRQETPGFHTPKSQFAKSYQPTQVNTHSQNTAHHAVKIVPNMSNYRNQSWQEQARKDQARQRLMERMKEIDTRVKSRRGGTKPWEVNSRPNTHVLDGVPDQDQSKLIVPPLMDEDGVWRDPVSSSPGITSPTNMASANFDDGVVKSLQSRVEYYKTCLKSNESKLDELIDSEKELHEMLENQQREHEQQLKQDAEAHEKEINEINEAMEEAKSAIDVLESTIEKLNEASGEKDECIRELKEKLGLVELELKERIITNEERVTDYEEKLTGVKKNVNELKNAISDKDEKIASAEKKTKALEEEVAKLADQCSKTESAYKSTCDSVQEKDRLLAKTVKDMEQEKNDLVFNFEQYRGDLEYKVEATSVRMEALVKEKDKLIGSLNRKINLLESSLAEKEGEVKENAQWKLRHIELEATWMVKEKELNNNIQTLAMSMTEKDKDLDNVKRLLEDERKLKAASDEMLGTMKNELSKCQQELIKERRRQNEALLIAQTLTPRSAARRKHHHKSSGREPRREDPPASPRARQGGRQAVYERSPRNHQSPRASHGVCQSGYERSPRNSHSTNNRYEVQVEEACSTDYESADSIFDFTS
jgi:predicted  nucleic acid-binding Zn-ribbon protein